ncbi:hypothetical protein [Aquisediminimonas profunda]|uniref:hypothetical protein n=1 Tax=Aquisediminimonas profunda TaxID=1550733 RepID=UPI001C63AD72|nr:hypothetical protein [Aquisediminimonas profunda]
MTEFKSSHFDSRAVARTLLRKSRARAQYFDADLLGDPVWELLLTLFEAEESKHVCAISDLRQGSTMSADTLQRWIKVLERRGLLTTIADAGMLNAGLVKLTGQAHRAMASYLMDITHLDPERF